MSRDIPKKLDVLVFDLAGDYAHFSKPFTTISPLTFSVPTGTALLGLLGALIGKEKDSYHQEFNECGFKIAIRIMQPIRKVKISLNLLQTKDGDAKKNFRTQVPFEFVKDPRYRIYVGFPEEKSRQQSELFKEFKEFLSQEKSVFTPYLGIGECLGKIEFKGAQKGALLKSANYQIQSILPTNQAEVSRIEDGKVYVQERISRDMNQNREVQNFVDVVYEEKGKALFGKGNVHRVGSDNIVFF